MKAPFVDCYLAFSEFKTVLRMGDHGFEWQNHGEGTKYVFRSRSYK